MKLRLFAFVFAVLGCMLTGIDADAQLNYGFKMGTGERITGDFQWLQYGSRAGAAQESGWGYAPSNDWVSLDFVFNFNGVDYSEVVISSNGVLMLGEDLGLGSTNDLDGLSGAVIAPFWDAMRVRSGGNGCDPAIVQFMTVGDEPNRIFVVDYEEMGLTQGTNGINAIATFQVRLYEGSNKIEFYYDLIDPNDQSCNQWGGGGAGTVTTSASIGLATRDGFISISPNGNSATSNSSSANNDVDAGSITDGTLYTFCPAGLKGDVAEGGTDGMLSGDMLLSDKQVIIHSTQDFQPFTLHSFCASSFTYTITGPNASEYSISPSSGGLPSEGNTPVITFSPTALGRRTATLHVVDGENFVNRTFVLAAEGTPRTTWVGDIPQGGTADLGDGDTLLANIRVFNGDEQSFTPFTIEVLPGGSTPASITYSLTDPTGQFRIDRTSDNVAPGSSAAPVITFAPTLIGWQTARLTVNAEGEVRSYLIRAFARGSGALFSVAGQPLGSGASVFRNVYACVGGTEVQTVEIRVESIGDIPFVIGTGDAYETENVIRQGTPPFELLRDAFGGLVPVQDYFISAAPGSNVSLPLPLEIQPLSTQTIYLNFLPSRSGKRQARAFFQTNGLNFHGIDTNKSPVQGMLNFELVGTGLGAQLTNPAGDKLPQTVLFPPTEVRSTSTVTSTIRNNGECDMLIPVGDFRLVSGDVNEFKIVTGMSAPTDARGNYVIAPGQTASFDVSFTPTRSGSRRASIRVRTNDSTIMTRGVSERGAYYLDVFGVGKVGLEGRLVSLPPAVIGGASSRGRALLENTSGELVTVTAITVQDPSGEIVEDPTNTWPALPLKLDPGKTAELGLAFTVPAGGTPGQRTATLEVTLSNGDVLTIDIVALAGTQELTVSPVSLFQGVSIDVGESRRQFVAVTNTGTFPVKVQRLDLTETNPGDYSVSALVRGVMEPGQVEFYEVTYSPQAIGVSGGTLEIVSNATNGPHVVMLGGEGTSIAPIGGGGSGTTIPVTGEDVVAIRPRVGITGWSASMENGTLLWQSNPNPTGDRADIRYFLPTDAKVELDLYSSNGRLVKEVVSEIQTSGEHRVGVDVRDLASGRYYYTLRTPGGALTLAIDVVK